MKKDDGKEANRIPVSAAHGVKFLYLAVAFRFESNVISKKRAATKESA
jgi:hypothetical protein